MASKEDKNNDEVRLVVKIEGGCITSICSDTMNCRVLVVDHDVEDIGEEGIAEEDVAYFPHIVEQNFLKLQKYEIVNPM